MTATSHIRTLIMMHSVQHKCLFSAGRGLSLPLTRYIM